MNTEYYLFVFDSTNNAIAAQKLLSVLNVIVMPTLREITASCGMALRLPPERVNEAIKIMTASKAEGWRLYHVKHEGNHNLCKLVTKP